MNVPSTTNNPEQRIRIDALFSIIFKNGESVSYSEVESARY